MSRKQHSGVFMMEMIMVVFFFILCASICILVFVKADRLSRRADDLNQGVLAAQSVAEVWKAEDESGLKKRFQAQAGEDKGSLVMEFGKDGNIVAAEDAVYVVTLLRAAGTEAAGQQAGSEAPAGSGVETAVLQQAKVIVSRGGEPVYTLPVSRHESAE